MRSAISNTTFNRAPVSRLAALFPQQFERDIHSKDVDVCHDQTIVFFAGLSHTTTLNKDEC